MRQNLFFNSAINLNPVYYVSTSGNDNNTGLTITQPWATLTKCATVPAGSTVALKKGDTWEISNVWEVSKGGTSGKVITYDGNLWGTGAKAKVKYNCDGANSPVWYSAVHIANCQYLTIQNITFDVSGYNRHGIVIGGDHATYGPTPQNNEAYITIQDCSVLNVGRSTFYGLGILTQTWLNDIRNVSIRRCLVDGVGSEAISSYCGRSDEGTPRATRAENHNWYVGFNKITNFGRSGALGEAIQINNKTTDAIVEFNEITTGASGTGHCIAIEHNEPSYGWYPTNTTIRYNKVTQTQENSFCIYAQSGEAMTGQIYGNILSYNSGDASDANGGSIWFAWNYEKPWTNASFKVYNNTLYTVGGRSFQNDVPVQNVVNFKNNIVYNTGIEENIYGNTTCIKINTGGNTIHSNNAIYRSASTGYGKVIDASAAGVYLNTNAQILIWEPTSIPTNPGMVTPGTNFHLTSNASVRGRGVYINDISIIYDYDGTMFANPPSIGAFEYI